MDGQTKNISVNKYWLIIAFIIIVIIGYLIFSSFKPSTTTSTGQIRTGCDDYLRWFTYSDDQPAIRRAECNDKPPGESASYYVKCSKSFCHTIYNPAGTGYYTPPNYHDYAAQYSTDSPVWLDISGKSTVTVKFYYKSPNFTRFSIMGKNCTSPIYEWTELYGYELEMTDSWELVNESFTIPSTDFCAVALEFTLHEVQEAFYSGINIS
ncbi:MAG: hypothetical protein OH319_00240 [Candidatus Parvarchaeota archaeon]|nr:hypothetical protein [Candidatus Jingweiarchaeum tengchongense]MCW1298427.1 hypothetical protein [Candidatus Jingweiarchaeum tengchongense]MCW1310837.1 hypothetical protein [Candidatus Jingweiarchaeum tengchongense]